MTEPSVTLDTLCQPGTMVVYHGTGICRVLGIEQQTAAGMVLETIRMEKVTGGTVLVPLKQAHKAFEQQTLRPMPSRSEVAKALRTLRSAPKRKPSGAPSRWMAQFNAKLDSYDVQCAAEVVRDLVRDWSNYQIGVTAKGQTDKGLQILATCWQHVSRRTSDIPNIIADLRRIAKIPELDIYRRTDDTSPYDVTPGSLRTAGRVGAGGRLTAGGRPRFFN